MQSVYCQKNVFIALIFTSSPLSQYYEHVKYATHSHTYGVNAQVLLPQQTFPSPLCHALLSQSVSIFLEIFSSCGGNG